MDLTNTLINTFANMLVTTGHIKEELVKEQFIYFIETLKRVNSLCDEIEESRALLRDVRGAGFLHLNPIEDLK